MAIYQDIKAMAMYQDIKAMALDPNESFKIRKMENYERLYFLGSNYSIKKIQLHTFIFFYILIMYREEEGLLSFLLTIDVDLVY